MTIIEVMVIMTDADGKEHTYWGGETSIYKNKVFYILILMLKKINKVYFLKRNGNT
jgi:hypothetical protein